MEVWYNNAPINNNQFLQINETQNKPEIKLNVVNNKKYMLIMHDPDAIKGNYIHWVVSDIQNNDIDKGITQLKYVGPSPPPNTGKHRYIFELYEQKSNIIPFQDRIISIEKIREQYTLNEPIKKIQFISENKNKSLGGKKRTRCRSKQKVKSKRSGNKKTRRNNRNSVYSIWSI